ncbi:nitrilase-related carbon-nitrogen hydrolase [Candidatus Poriferisodalis sp.]|uniref:nitrilase-related carbon-nitrogen hydrolase n=1 Tax=Candidatus Poriferisodalis sp. TaxID=3101277 RepID=UPI003B029DBC
MAAAQFATGTDLDENLDTCVRMLDTAAAEGAELVVLPEFCNHISVYDDAEHCRAVAVPLDGPWLGTLAGRAAALGVYAALAVTVPRPSGRTTATNVLVDPDGNVAVAADKQMLMGNERAFLSGGTGPTPIAGTPFGLLGLYSCMDGVTFEVPRTLAVRGARLLLNSLNSFARDEAALHIPVRAAENGVFVAAANKVGPLIPADRVQAFSEALGVPTETFEGAGESQIVAPDGTVLAVGPATGEAVVAAEVDLLATEPQRLRGRRPQVYAPLARPQTARPAEGLQAELTVACVPGARGEPALAPQAAAAGAQLVVLPELTPVPAAMPGGVLVVTTAMRGDSHVGQVWLDGRIVGEQPQVHRSERHPGATRLGETVELCRTPFGDLAVLVGDDHRYPETARLAATAGAHIVAVCWQPEHRWETELGLVERAAENRLVVAACAPPDAPKATMMCDPPADSLWNPNRSKPYDGTINMPAVVRAEPGCGLLLASLHPGRAVNREVSKDTDLVAGRPWQAAAVLAEAALAAKGPAAASSPDSGRREGVVC